MSSKIAIYIRVSTGGQDLGSQEPDLERWLMAYGEGQESAWYRETFTGKTMDRPVMKRLQEDIRQGRVGRLVVWRLDRLGRTAVQMLQFLNELDSRKVEFVSVRDGIDSSTASGRLMRTILAGFSEYEREVISERINAGIAKAHAAGKRWGGSKKGHRRKLKPKVVKSIHEMLHAGITKVEIGRLLQINRRTVREAAGMNGRVA